MGEIGGYREDIDWPKLGPSLLIASCLIVAIRTAKRLPVFSSHTYDGELDKEVDYAIHVAGRVLSHLVSQKESLFPRKREPWYHANEEDEPK
jgi:hypothetical protein